MSRIVAGQAGGARLAAVRGQNTRPTTDRVKESLFSRLESYGILSGARVLDLFAGSGALGLEAASRGAAEVVLVDRDHSAVQACRKNQQVLARAGSPARVQVVPSTARACLARLQGAWDLVFLDPPYAMEEQELAELLAEFCGPSAAGELQGNGLRLAQGAVVVVERSTRSPEPVWPEGLERFGHRAFGETSLWYAEPRGEDDAGD